MKRGSLVLATGFLLAALAAWAQVPRPSSTQTSLQDPPRGANTALLIRLGIGDRSETEWDGSLEVEAGKLMQLTGYEFRVGDLIHPPSRWEARSREAVEFRRRTWDGDYLKPPTGPTVLGPSLYVYVRATPATRVRIKTTQGDFDFRVSDVPIGTTQPLLDGRASIEHVVYARLVGRGGDYPGDARIPDNDHPAITVARDGSTWVSWQAYADRGDRVFAEKLTPGSLLASSNEPHAVSLKKGDIYRTAIEEDTEGKIWVVWSERLNDDWDLYARSFDGNSWSAIERLTEASQPDTQHQLVRDSRGRLHLVWQGYRNNRGAILHKEFDPASGWSNETLVSAPGAPNCWDPSLAADRDGNVFAAWDQYGPNGYDAWLRPRIAGEWKPAVGVATTASFEAHVSIAADDAGRVWMAWDESGINWGKDFGYPFDITLPGTGLYSSRRMRFAVYENGELHEPVQQLANALPRDDINFYELPKISVDGSGRVWCFFRHRTPLEINVHNRTPSHYALWAIYASYYERGRWSPMMLLPYSTGINDQRMHVAADRDGSLIAAWPTDRRNFRDFTALLPDVFVARTPRFDDNAQPQLVPYQQPSVEPAVVHTDESGDLERIRAYTYTINGEQLKIYRGDMHRHTEFSWDGYNDGSLQDAYRYAIDAADFDYLAVTEHVFGADHEYDWWRTQKAADLYRIGNRFVPLFAYERSVAYPNGHRNIIFSYRGVRELDIQAHELSESSYPLQGAERLFAYLRRHQGISTPHTSGTSMGTDWRDYDPEVEPIVEIYQSDRNSYERVGGWRSADPEKPATQHGGYRPDGMVSVAWEKGYRLGVQASSDHMGVHTSYAMVLAPELARTSLLDAMRKRHTYAATDNIILDFRLIDGAVEYLMGDEAMVSSPPRFRVHVEGTAALGEVELVKDNKLVYSQQPQTRVVDFEYRDEEGLGEGVRFYYVRVRQSDQDKQVAWSSPIWVARGAR